MGLLEPERRWSTSKYMKKNLRLGASFLGLIGLLLGLGLVIPVSAESVDPRFRIQLFAVLGPPRADAAYTAWANPLAQELLLVDEYSINYATGDLGYRLLPEYVSRDTGQSNWVLWFAVVATQLDTNASPVLALNMLKFVQVSSDSGNKLGNVYDLSSMEGLIYTPRASGLIYGDGIKMLQSGEPGSTLVHKVCFVGMQSPYFAYPLVTVKGWMNNFANLKLTCQCQLVSGGNIVAVGQKTLQTTGTPAPFRLSVTSNGGTALVAPVGLEGGRSIIIYSSPDLLHPDHWTPWASANAGDVLKFPINNSGQRFFRGVLE